MYLLPPRVIKVRNLPESAHFFAGALPSPHHSLSGAARRIGHSRDERLLATHPESRRPLRARSPPPATGTIGTGSTRLAARPATIKTQRQNTRLVLGLDADAEEATRWWTTTLLIAQVAWTSCVKCESTGGFCSSAAKICTLWFSRHRR